MQDQGQLTPEQLEQFRRKVSDKYWRMTNLYKIKAKDQSVIPFKPNRIQRMILKDVQGFGKNPIRYFNLKARQMGVSTFWELYFLDEVLFNRNYTCGVMAHKWESLKYLMGIVRFIYDNMNPEFRPPAEISETRIFIPSINSRMIISLEIISTTLNALHISEVCKCKDMNVKTTMAGVLANETCDVVLESTAEGMKGIGYALWQSANEDISKSKNGIQRKFLPWFVHEEYKMSMEGMNPESELKEFKMRTHTKKMILFAKTFWGIELTDEQLYWYKQKESVLKELMPQEHPYCDTEAFMASGGNFFNLEKVRVLYDEAIEYEADPGYAEIGQDYIMYKRPQRYHEYVLGCDPANGGSNYFVFKIIDVTAREESFRFRARCSLGYGYHKVDEWGRQYNNALVAVEVENHGHAVLQGLNEILRYPNLYRRDDSNTRMVKSNVKKKLILGWSTKNRQVKTFMLDDLRFSVEGNYEEDVDHFSPLIHFYDKTLLEECFTFIEKEGKIEAADDVDKDTEHGQGFDDDIMATAIAMQMYKIQRRHVDPVTNEPQELRIHLHGENYSSFPK